MRDIAFRHPEMLSVEDFYLRYNFSKGFIAPHGMTHQQLVAALSRGFADIEPHEHRSVDFEVTELRRLPRRGSDLPHEDERRPFSPGRSKNELATLPGMRLIFTM